MVKTLTSGNIYKQITVIALPLLVGNLLQQLYNSVDMYIVGEFVGEDAFASVGVSGSVMNLFIHIIMGLCVGFSILYANNYGAQNLDRMRKTVFTTFVIGMVFSLFLAAVAAIFMDGILSLIKTPAEIREYCKSYLYIIFAGIIFILAYNLSSAILRAIGKTDITLYALIISMVTNIILDLLFVAVFKMGVIGAAIATIGSQFLSALLCFLYIFLKHPYIMPKRKDFVIRPALLLSCTQYGSVSALQQSSLYIGKLLIQGAVNSMGTIVVSAYTAVTCFENILLSVGQSGSAAISVFTAQNHGAGVVKRVKKGFWSSLLLMAGTGVVIVFAMFLLKELFVDFLIPDGDGHDEAVRIGVEYLTTMSLFFISPFISNTFQGFFRGVGKVNTVLIVTTVQITIRVALTYLFPVSMGLARVAIATGCGWCSMIIVQTIVMAFFAKKKLKNNDTCHENI